MASPTPSPPQDLNSFHGKRVLITGGLGFIGSNLAIRLVTLGARVTLLDAMLEHHGGNPFNIDPIKDEADVHISDVRCEPSLTYLVRGQDYVFHLASQNDHLIGQHDPFPDIDINVRGAAVLLEACRRHAPEARLIYTGTRGEYGSAIMPVGEDQPTNPRGVYELSSLVAGQLFSVYHHRHGLRAVTLRLSNIYGERAQMRHHRFGVANWFLRLAIDDATIPVYGDGLYRRDFVHVDDTVDALLRCAATEEAYGQVFNVGNDHPSNFRELAETIVRVAGSGRWELVAFSPERAAQEPGDYCSDVRKIERVTGWKPTISLEDGVRKAVEYYRQHRGHYWN
jgi:UDP-glucose 4-epimerase